jgi:hypothetical protein
MRKPQTLVVDEANGMAQILVMAILFVVREPQQVGREAVVLFRFRAYLQSKSGSNLWIW